MQPREPTATESYDAFIEIIASEVLRHAVAQADRPDVLAWLLDYDAPKGVRVCMDVAGVTPKSFYRTMLSHFGTPSA